MFDLLQGAIMAVGASKPTAVADKDGYFSVKNQMMVSFIFCILNNVFWNLY